MKFYMTPGSCSTGVHILLEEAGLVFEAHIVDLVRGDNLKPDYLAINPNGTIPTLVLDDGTALTDFISIALWIGKTFPRRKLIPEDPQAEQLCFETLNFATRHIHGEGFRRVFVAESYVTKDKDVEAVRAQGREIVARALETVDGELAGKAYVAGGFSIADAALFYVEFWADKTRMTLPPNCRAHYDLMRARPAVRQVLAEEGYRQTP